MKILFIYNKLDNTLQDRVARLKAHNAKVSTLSLLEYKLDEDGKVTTFDIDSKLDFLEKSKKLRVANRVYKRKKLLSYLDDYDIIDIYKCEKSAIFLKDKIEELCYAYFITPSSEISSQNFTQKHLYSSLFNGATFIIFDSLDTLESCSFGDAKDYRLVCAPQPLINEMEQITDAQLFKASRAMGLDLQKDIVYCDLSGDIANQLSLIEGLSSLKIEKLKNTTFIFTLNQHNLEERSKIKEAILSKNFDYLLIETLMTPKQRALIHKVANRSIILSYSQTNPALILSLYAKNFVYLYYHAKVDGLFEREKIFMKSFDDFRSQKVGESDPIEVDLCKQNSQKIYKLFEPENSIERYIGLIKEL